MATAPHLRLDFSSAVPTAEADAGHLRRGIVGSITAMGAALVGLVAVMFTLPTGYNAQWWGINPLGMWHWADHLHLPLPDALSAVHWSLLFRLGLVGLWSGYAALFFCAQRGGIPPLRGIFRLTAGFSLTLAVLAPPLLATDSYAYAAAARLPVLYGQNPYVVHPYAFLAAAHDPTHYFLAWDIPTVYGPIWTALAMLLVKMLPHQWLWGEIVGFKLIEAAALCLLTWSAGRIAERLQPGRGPLAALLVGLNPLLLLEGPGSGHNDLLMIALTLTGLAYFLERAHRRAGFWLGLAVGVKLLPLGLLAWLAMELRRTEPDKRARLRTLGTLTGWMVLPTLLGYAAFWHGTAALNTLQSRAQVGHSTLIWAALVYDALSFWLWKTNTDAGWLLAWAVVMAVLMLTGMGFAFPWYLVWVWPMLLVRFDRLSMLLSGAVFAFALVWESLYATLVPVRVLLGH